MPRPQTPLAIAEANGAVDQNRGRYEGRENAPQPTGPLGEPPNHLTDTQRDYWREIAALPARGVLTSADRLLVETLVYLVELQRLGDISPVDRGHLRACLGSMGLTPADRGRVNGSNVPKKKEDAPADPADRFVARAGIGRVK